MMYPPAAKTKDKVDKKHVVYMTTRITQAFAVYPDRPELINQSSLFKVEGTIKDEQVRTDDHTSLNLDADTYFFLKDLSCD
jgi:hypothetical protein